MSQLLGSVTSNFLLEDVVFIMKYIFFGPGPVPELGDLLARRSACWAFEQYCQHLLGECSAASSALVSTGSFEMSKLTAVSEELGEGAGSSALAPSADLSG